MIPFRRPLRQHSLIVFLAVAIGMGTASLARHEPAAADRIDAASAQGDPRAQMSALIAEEPD